MNIFYLRKEHIFLILTTVYMDWLLLWCRSRASDRKFNDCPLVNSIFSLSPNCYFTYCPLLPIASASSWFSLSQSQPLGASEVVWWLRTHLPVQEAQETWVQSLGWEDPREKEMTTHSSILTCKIPWTEKPGRLQSMGLQRVGHNPKDTFFS